MDAIIEGRGKFGDTDGILSVLHIDDSNNNHPRFISSIGSGNSPLGCCATTSIMSNSNLNSCSEAWCHNFVPVVTGNNNIKNINSQNSFAPINTTGFAPINTTGNNNPTKNNLASSENIWNPANINKSGNAKNSFGALSYFGFSDGFTATSNNFRKLSKNSRGEGLIGSGNCSTLAALGVGTNGRLNPCSEDGILREPPHSPTMYYSSAGVMSRSPGQQQANNNKYSSSSSAAVNNTSSTNTIPGQQQHQQPGQQVGTNNIISKQQGINHQNLVQESGAPLSKTASFSSVISTTANINSDIKPSPASGQQVGSSFSNTNNANLSHRPTAKLHHHQNLNRGSPTKVVGAASTTTTKTANINSTTTTALDLNVNSATTTGKGKTQQQQPITSGQPSEMKHSNTAITLPLPVSILSNNMGVNCGGPSSNSINQQLQSNNINNISRVNIGSTTTNPKMNQMAPSILNNNSNSSNSSVGGSLTSSKFFTQLNLGAASNNKHNNNNNITDRMQNQMSTQMNQISVSQHLGPDDSSGVPQQQQNSASSKQLNTKHANSNHISGSTILTNSHSMGQQQQIQQQIGAAGRGLTATETSTITTGNGDLQFFEKIFRNDTFSSASIAIGGSSSDNMTNNNNISNSSLNSLGCASNFPPPLNKNINLGIIPKTSDLTTITSNQQLNSNNISNSIVNAAAATLQQEQQSLGGANSSQSGTSNNNIIQVGSMTAATTKFGVPTPITTNGGFPNGFDLWPGKFNNPNLITSHQQPDLCLWGGGATASSTNIINNSDSNNEELNANCTTTNLILQPPPPPPPPLLHLGSGCSPPPSLNANNNLPPPHCGCATTSFVFSATTTTTEYNKL